MYGGLFLTVPVAVVVVVLADLPFWTFWDAAGITMLVGMIFTRFGCTLNGCCAGRETAGRFGMWMPNYRGELRRRYPTQLMEAALASVVLAAPLLARPLLPFEGTLFALVVSGYTAGRLVLQRLRESSG